MALDFWKSVSLDFFSPRMRFSSSWLKRLIWMPRESPLLGTEVALANHNTVNSPPSKWDQLSPVTQSLASLWKVDVNTHTHTCTYSLTSACKKDFKVAETDGCRSARYLKSIVHFIIHTFVCLPFAPALAAQLLPLTIYMYTFLPPSLLLLLSVCLCSGWKRGNVFIVSGWI